MTIDISKLYGGSVGSAGTTKPGAVGKPDAEASPVNPARDTDDTVSLTSMGSELQNLEQRVTEAPMVNQERIQSIKDALSRGDYPFNPERIAEKMLDMEKFLSH
jgi:flagellar biosynthesis anti-sigma factor FlgM